MTITQASTSAALQGLIESIRQIMQRESEPASVAAQVVEHLSPYLETDDLLTAAQQEPDPNQYRQHILHVEADGSFSIVALVWLPGQETCIHDHVSWCVVGVHQGREYETTYVLHDADDGSQFLTENGNSINPPGSVAALTPPGDIHKVANDGSGLAISLHIYGADIGKLGSSIRRRYDQEVRIRAGAHAA